MTLFPLHQMLLKLPAEWAHDLAIQGLKVTPWLPDQRFPSPPIVLPSMPRIQFRNRLGLAAGFDKNAEAIPGLERLGFGFLEVGTVTPLPQPGNPKPRIWRTASQGLINRLGFNNCGGETFRTHLEFARKRVTLPVFANIGKNKITTDALSDYQKLLELLAPVVDGFVINISSPNTEGLRSLQSVDFLEKLSKQIPLNTPTLVKFAPDLPDLDLENLLNYLKNQPTFAGVVLTNTSRELALRLENRSEGGYSGPELFHRSKECVKRARKILGSSKVIIGVGGVNSVERALEMREAGADLVEIYTAFIYQGPELIKKIVLDQRFKA